MASLSRQLLHITMPLFLVLSATNTQEEIEGGNLQPGAPDVCRGPRIPQSHVCGKIAYVSQDAWIQTGTLQENILFGSNMDKQRYEETPAVFFGV